MKNTFVTLVSAVAVSFVVAQTTQATPITGNIGFSGTAVLDTPDAGTATKATSIVANLGSISDSGMFAGSVFTAVNFNVGTGWTFNNPSTTFLNFWTVTGSPLSFSFDLLNSSASTTILGGITFLNVVINGIVKDGTAADNTAFVGTFQIANPPANGTTTFTARLSFNPPGLPDGGTTVMLLGAALSGMALIKRKLMA